MVESPVSEGSVFDPMLTKAKALVGLLTKVIKDNPSYHYHNFSLHINTHPPITISSDPMLTKAKALVGLLTKVLFYT